MRKFLAAALLILCASAVAMASQPISKVELPCDSNDQTLSPTGSQAAVQCKDHSLHLVSIPAGNDRVVLPADRPANTYVFSPDGKWFAIGFKDGTVQVNATASAAAAKEWKAGSHRIDLLYFLPDSKTLFVGPVDSPGTMWDVSGNPTLRATLPVAFGGIAVCAASPDGKQVVVAGDDTVIRWYDTATWQKTREYSGFLLETFALAFTPDGKQLLAGGADARITVFDAASGKVLRQFGPEDGSSVIDIKLLGKGQRAATLYMDDAGGKPPHALVWDMETAKSSALKTDAPPSCGSLVAGNLWICTTDNRTMTISQYD
jgi:WD40 repeat protein